MVMNPPADGGDMGSIPGLGRSSGGGNGNLLQYYFFFFFTPVFLPGESNGQRSLSAYSPWGCRHDLATKQQQQRYEKTFVFKNDFILDNVGALERTQPNIQR